MVDGQCSPCLPGFFKNHTNPYQCVQWDDALMESCPQGFFAVNGTRFQDAECIPLPCSSSDSAAAVPENSSLRQLVVENGTAATKTGAVVVVAGCEWVCDPGFMSSSSSNNNTIDN